MTIVKNHREYKINNTTYFVERYADKPHFVWFWRYGYVDRSGLGRTIGGHASHTAKYKAAEPYILIYIIGHRRNYRF